MPSLERIIKLFKNENVAYLKQESSGYQVEDKKGTALYQISAKVATTRGHYFISKGTELIGEIKRKQYENKYDITEGAGENRNLVGEMGFYKDRIEFTYKSIAFHSKSELRGKNFDFSDQSGQLRFIVDKKTIRIKDEYVLGYLSIDYQYYAVLASICIDDFYHSGTKKA